jgi:hypothetical protein
VVLQLGEIEEWCGQQASVLLPPAACPVGRHGDQGADEGFVGTHVVGCEAAQPLLAHACEAGFDVGDLGGADAK